jgi:hypothetical protein
MKLLVRSTIGFLFLLALAMPSLAQNPNLAIKIGPPPTPQACFPVTIKNVRATPINTTAAYLYVFDQKTCKRVCEFKISFPKTLAPCQSASFKICCQKSAGPLPPTWIAYVRVHYAGGWNEQWLWRP